MIRKEGDEATVEGENSFDSVSVLLHMMGEDLGYMSRALADAVDRFQIIRRYKYRTRN